MSKGKPVARTRPGEKIKTIRLEPSLIAAAEAHRRSMKRNGDHKINPTWSDAVRDLIRRGTRHLRKRQPAA